MKDKLLKAEAGLLRLLGPNMQDLDKILADVQKEVSERRYQIELPDANTIDMPVEELRSLVARSSNAYGRIARFAGIARAEAKIAKGRYDRKRKGYTPEGKNEAERQANTMQHCEEEHIAMTIADSIADFADSMEHAARVSSESARKMYDKVVAMYVAQGREDKGQYPDKDFEY